MLDCGIYFRHLRVMSRSVMTIFLFLYLPRKPVRLYPVFQMTQTKNGDLKSLFAM